VDEIIYKPTEFGVLATRVKAMVDQRSRPSNQRSEIVSHAPQAVSLPRGDENPNEPVSLSQLNAKLEQIGAILPVSSSALDVYEMTRSVDWKVSQIGAAIQRDASLAIEVLRLANSSLYNPSGRQIVSLDEAVVRIGQKRVGELALATNALSTVAPRILPWIDLELTWKRSMAAGIALEYLVESGVHHEVENGLLLSAIMHPLGRVALAMLFPKHYAAMVERCQQTGEALREEERRMFPTSHTEIMSHLLANWRVPREVFSPLKYSLDDFSALSRLPEPTRTSTELVKIANLLGRLAVSRWENWDLVQFPSSRVLGRLRIKNARQIVHQTKSDLTKIADFHPGRAPGKQPTVPAPIGRSVAYSNPSDDEVDLFIELLPSFGIAPRTCSVGDLQHAKEALIVNCLGAVSTGFATNGGWNKPLFITSQENYDAFEGLARPVILPDSYARLREAIQLVVDETKAANTVDASCT
jgi:HD-like signal output (HDOD) protein